MVTGAYRPRSPKASPLYQCVQAHFGEFEAAYPTRYQEEYGFYRPLIVRVARRPGPARFRRARGAADTRIVARAEKVNSYHLNVSAVCCRRGRSA